MLLKVRKGNLILISIVNNIVMLNNLIMIEVMV